MALAVLPVLATGCGVGAPNAEVAPARPVAAETPDPARAVAGAELAVGATVAHKMLTHCGVEGTKINGSWWDAVKPLYGPSGEGAGPPGGWDEPWQAGDLTLEKQGRAVFEAVGERVVLTRSPDNEPIRNCR